MLYGCISKGNTQISFYIKVDGSPEVGYMGYSLKDAIRKYRTENNLIYKHINFLDLR